MWTFKNVCTNESLTFLNVVVVWLLSHVLLFATPWTHHASLPCPSPSPRACSNSCPSSQWYHLTILSCVIPFSSCLQSFQALGSFLMSLLFISGGQSIGTSASASVLPMNIQGWAPLGLIGLISLLSEGLSRVLQHHRLKVSILQCSVFFMVQLSHPNMITGKTIALSMWTFDSKVVSLLFKKTEGCA